MREELLKEAGTGMIFDYSAQLGSAEGAFSSIDPYETISYRGTVVGFTDADDETELEFLGLLMEPTEYGEVKLLNCKCVMDAFSDLGRWDDEEGPDVGVYPCASPGCSSVQCETCRMGGPDCDVEVDPLTMRPMWYCPLACKNRDLKNLIPPDEEGNGYRVGTRADLYGSDWKVVPECRSCRITEADFLRTRPGSKRIGWRLDPIDGMER